MAIWVNSYTLKGTQHQFATAYAFSLYAGLYLTLVTFLIDARELHSHSIDKKPKQLHYMRFDTVTAVVPHNTKLKCINKLCFFITWNQISEWMSRC